MAVNLQKTTSINVGVVVNNAVSAVQSARARDKAEKESAFQQAVADGLDYAGQIAYREKQLADEEASGFVDSKYRAELKESLASTKRLKRFYDYRTKYQEALGELNAGHTNAVEYAKTLRKLFNDASDPDLRAEIQTNLTTAETMVSNYRQTTLANQVKLAEYDGTEKEINKVIKKVKAAKSVAQIAGNDDEVAAYDLTLASLNSQKVQTKSENLVNDIAVKGMLGNTNATEKLKTLNLQVADSDTDTPITIDGKRYESEQQYWEITRNAYLSGAGGGVFADYFGDLENQYKQKIDGETARYGFVQPSTIQRINNELTTLRSNPEMAPFIDRIDSFRALAVSDAVGTVAKTVIDRAQYTGDFIQADDTLKGLSSTYNVDTTGYQLQLGTILNSQINAAIAAGESISPELLNALPSEDFATPEVTTTVPGEPTPTPKPSPTAVPGAPTPTPAPASTQRPDYVVKQGDSLSAIAGRNNMTLNQLLELNPTYKANPNLVQTGATIKLAQPAPATPPVEPVKPTKTEPSPALKKLSIENSPKNTGTQTMPTSNKKTPTSTNKDQEKQLQEIAKQIAKLKPQVEEFVRRRDAASSSTINQ